MANRLTDMLFFSGARVISKLTDKIVSGAGMAMDYMTILFVMVLQASIIFVLLWGAFMLLCAGWACVPPREAVVNTTSLLVGQLVGAR